MSFAGARHNYIRSRTMAGRGQALADCSPQAGRERAH